MDSESGLVCGSILLAVAKGSYEEASVVGAAASAPALVVDVVHSDDDDKVFLLL
jgi:hypothetical protein